MKRLICMIFSIIVMLSFSSSMAEGLLPQLTDVYGVGMPSLQDILFREPESTGTLGDGTVVLSYADVREKDYDAYGKLLAAEGCSLQTYTVDGSRINCTISKLGKIFYFSYDTEAHQAEFRHPKGTFDEPKKRWLSGMNYRIAAGYNYIIGLLSDGTVLAEGNNDYGQCDTRGWTDIIAVAAGYSHTVGLRANGKVKAVGSNTSSQCDTSNWTDIVAIAAADFHTLGLRADGTVVAVGNNKNGCCDTENWTGIIAVAAANNHTVGLKSDGTVIAIGNNVFGQCNTENWTDIIAVAAGSAHTVGLKSDGTVIAIGRNGSGQCNTENWTDIIAVAAGYHHTVGLRSDGTVIAVGENHYGQCNINEWTNIIEVSSGSYRTVGLRADGTVVMAGDDDDGKIKTPDWILLADSSESLASVKVNTSTSKPTAAPKAIAAQQPTPVSTLKVGEKITFGSYEQDNRTSNGKKPITWTVLSVEGNKALVISEYALDTLSYGKAMDISEYQKSGFSWKTSALRTWLNSTFINAAFSVQEKQIILSVDLTTEDAAGKVKTTDRVFVLSIAEADRYFRSQADMNCKVTEFGKSKLKADSNAVRSEGYCLWWLRDMASVYHQASAYRFMDTTYNEACAVFYNSKGTANAKDGKGCPIFCDYLITVRPAMWIAYNPSIISTENMD